MMLQGMSVSSSDEVGVVHQIVWSCVTCTMVRSNRPIRLLNSR